MNWTIEFLPFVPIPYLVGAGLVALLIALVLIWRGRRGALLRAVSLALLIAALANPNLKEEEREPLSNIAVVVVDKSASQRIAGREERTAAIRTQLAERLGSLDHLEIRWVESSGGASSAAEETTLFADLDRALSDVPSERLAGVVMITDGEIHDVPTDVKKLGFDAPVHALIVGTPNEFDNRLEVISAPRFGLVGSEQMVELRAVTNRKDAASGPPATLKVRRADQSEDTLTVPFGQTVRLPFPFPHAGTTLMEVELAGEPGELTLANNRVALQAEGVRENLRVLLVSGEPHAGERTWRNLLRSDASVDLVHFTILRPPEKQDGTPINQLSLIAFPTRELFSEKLAQFDLIIFDRYQRRGVLPLIYLDNVARYVEDGGAVLVAAGADYASDISLFRTPLGDILPAQPTGRVIEQPFRPMITEIGERHPVTSGLAGENATPEAQPHWGRWFRVVESTAREGTVVMNGPDSSPLLVLSRRGKGRVATFLSDHVWLWARGYEGGGPYLDLLRRLSHWLMKEPDLEEEFLKATADRQSIVVERHSMKDEIGSATITTPTDKTVTVPMEKAGPGLWRGRFQATEPGVHKIAMDGLAAVALVGNGNSREFSKVAATDEPLRPVADATGGGQFWMGGTNGAAARDMPRLTMLRSATRYYGQNWLGLKDREAYVVRGVQYTPLLAGFFALALFIGLIMLTWFRESR
ncbi:MAG: hypothetical protein WBP94_07715 [Rhodomicrobiaceae bacterium]